ncbi:MAG: GNAT family N-acetyltransferase [Dehalococcoidia bacterium]|nr:GNAT family N-acetyltransferase [Dehalococcoidia bacterium]MYI86065.1 GNAT family N-acetyltransferase [Dehalococcoidia bacterium]
MSLSLGALREGDLEANHHLVGASFGSSRAFDPDRALPPDQVLAGYDERELVATATLIPGGQWFGGRPIDGVAVSAVGVAPHRRGEGISKALMVEALRLIHERGAAISTLFPTTASLYRSVGYEMAGDYVKRTIPLTDLATANIDADVESFTADDLQSLAPAYDALARLSSGSVARGEAWWERRRARTMHADVRVFLVRVQVAEGIGYVVMAAQPSERSFMDLRIDDLGAENGAALRALGTAITRFGTVTGTVTAFQPPWVLETLTDHGQRWKARESIPWMVRLVDLAKAIEQRGWPPVTATVALHVSDSTLSHNDGRFELQVVDGKGTLTPGGPGTWRVDIRSLASWFTGWRSASQLASLGLLTSESGTAHELRVLDALTAGPPPLIPESTLAVGPFGRETPPF